MRRVPRSLQTAQGNPPAEWHLHSSDCPERSAPGLKTARAASGARLTAASIEQTRGCHLPRRQKAGIALDCGTSSICNFAGFSARTSSNCSSYSSRKRSSPSVFHRKRSRAAWRFLRLPYLSKRRLIGSSDDIDIGCRDEVVKQMPYLRFSAEAACSEHAESLLVVAQLCHEA